MMPNFTDAAGMHAETALLLLGLDRVASRYARMGLRFRDPARTRQGAREAWVWWRSDPERTPADPDAAAAILNALADRLGRAGAQADVPRAVTWARRSMASDALYAPRSAWTYALTRFGEPDAAGLRTLGMGAAATAAVARARDRLADQQDANEALGDELASEPLTEWDLARYRDYHPDYEYVTPVSPLLSWLITEAFDASVRDLAAALSASELRLLSAWVAATVEAKGKFPLPVPDAAEVQRRLAELPPWPDA